MSRFVALLCSRRAPHVAVLALMSIGFAGCSADMSTRLAQNQSTSGQPSQFGWQREATGSVAPPAPVERPELPQYARPQPQVQSSALPPSIAAPQSYPTGSGVSGGGRGLASYAPPARVPLETTGSVAPRSVAAPHGPGRERGTTIIVGTTGTLDLLAHR